MTKYTVDAHALPYPEGADRVALAEDLRALAVKAGIAITTEGSRVEQRLGDRLAAGLPWRGRMPNGTDVDTLTSAGVYLIATQAAADSMFNLAENYPGLFIVEGQASASTIIFSQTQKTYGTAPRKYERITAAAGLKWNAWEKTWPYTLATPMPAAAPTESALANKAWLDAFIQGRGGSIGTGGVAAVAIRVDHGAVNFRDKILPKIRERSIPVSFAINPGQDRLNLPENAGVTWEDYNSWALNDGVEFANHGMGHIDATTSAEMLREIAESKALLRSKLPNVMPEIFAVPGVSGTDMNGWTVTNSPEHFYAFEAGQLVLANHALCTGYVQGKLRPLTGTPVNGAAHYSIDSITTAATVISTVRNAQGMGAGLQIMLHPSQLDLDGKMRTTVLHEILDFLADERDAGRLTLMSMGGLFLADAGHGNRNNLLSNPSFSGLTGWSSTGSWEANGSFARTRSAEAGMLTQTVAMSDRKWAAGRVRELNAQFRSASGGVARLSVANVATGLNVSKDVPVPAGDGWVAASAFVTIPLSATNLVVSVGRVSGDVMDVQRPGLLAA